MSRVWLCLLLLFSSKSALSDGVVLEYTPPKVQSGYAVQTEGVRAMQDDDFANPAYLWVDRGRELWQQPAGSANKSCAHCHGTQGETLINGTAVSDAATRYPRYESSTDSLINLEQKINVSREQHQEATTFAWESEELLSLTAFVANLAHGKPVQVDIDGKARPYFDLGRTYYQARRGQLNLACIHCHDQYVGRKLRGDTITQGHGTGYPTYRLQWQAMGSLHRRLRNCNFGVRAEPLPYGSPIYLALELFLAWRAKGLTIEAPAVRP